MCIRDSTYTVETRLPRTVLHGKRFQTSHQDTVCNNQTYIYRKLYAYIEMCIRDRAKDDKKTKVIPTKLSVCPPGLLQSKEIPTKASAMENLSLIHI